MKIVIDVLFHEADAHYDVRTVSSKLGPKCFICVNCVEPIKGSRFENIYDQSIQVCYKCVASKVGTECVFDIIEPPKEAFNRISSSPCRYCFQYIIYLHVLFDLSLFPYIVIICNY